MFRCHIDPCIPPKPRNAFHIKEFQGSTFELTPGGVYVKIKLNVPGNVEQWSEHLVPFANLQSVKFLPLDPKEKE